MSFTDLIDYLNSDTQNWKRLCHIVSENYRKLSVEDEKYKDLGKLFENRIIKHYANDNKSVLLFSGSWNNFSPISVAHNLQLQCKLSFFVLNFVHPYTNSCNVSEMNPMVTSTSSLYSSSFFVSSKVCVGENRF